MINAMTSRTLLIQRLLLIMLLGYLTACTTLQLPKLPTKQQPIPSSPLNVKHVVLISVDGLRPDAINRDNAPHIYQLLQQGHYYTHAKTIGRSLTLPSHASMLTGLPVDIHRVVKNKPMPGYMKSPSIPTLLAKRDMTSAAFFSKKKMTYLFSPTQTNYMFGPGINGLEEKDTTAQLTAEDFKFMWSSAGYNFSFVHLREPDRSGHAYGWMSDDYLNRAIPSADNAVGSIIKTIQASRRAATTLVIITADHGGKNNDHWHGREEDQRIPWIAYYPQLTQNSYSNEWVSTMDTAPTILYLLGKPIPKNMQGKVVEGFRDEKP